jgi:thioredoxin reductase
MIGADPARLDAAKRPTPSVHVPLLVVGAGPAGVAAAIAAAASGVSTMLIEEQPVPPDLMALDVPLHYGQRMARGAGNAALMERVLDSSPGLAEAYERGIDVQLGVCVWGIFPGSVDSTGTVPHLVGLADSVRSWFVSCDRLIVASGARDLAIGFPGWEKPGVMGAQAALQLMERYDAFTGTRILLLGAGPLALAVAEAAIGKGLAVVAAVEAEGAPRHDECAERFQECGVAFYGGWVIEEARGSVEVESASIVRLDETGKPAAGPRTVLDCDTIVLAVGTVPNVELLDSLGCRMQFEPLRGGWVPSRGAETLTSTRHVYAIGDCAGLGADPTEEGRRAARAVAASLGMTAFAEAEFNPGPPIERPVAADRSVELARVWMQAQIAASGLDVCVCQCEEVTRRELIDLEPPRYLRAMVPDVAPGGRNLQALAADGPLNQDQVKRLTRAGMGPCQGRRCREQVQMLLEAATSSEPGTVPLARHRPPVRPLPLKVLAAEEESAALRDHWVAWFNIATQWLPHWEAKPVPFAAPGQAPVIGDGE